MSGGGIFSPLVSTSVPLDNDRQVQQTGLQSLEPSAPNTAMKSGPLGTSGYFSEPNLDVYQMNSQQQPPAMFSNFGNTACCPYESGSDQGQIQTTSLPLPESKVTKTSNNNNNLVKIKKDGHKSLKEGSIKAKRRPTVVDNDREDQSYWERRKKNNESAKRSRDARRVKEEQVAMRLVYLEQENIQLCTEVELLKSEIARLRHMVYNSSMQI